MNTIIDALSWVMNGCYSLVQNYGLAIVLFTFFSKIVLIPISVWTYFNSIKMIKIQPDINFIKAKYYGQKDLITEEQAKLQKEQGYHPLLSTIPLFVQLFLLMGVVEVIKRGIADPAINMSFGPIDLGLVPSQNGIGLIWSPLVAGVSSWILCIAQNKANILQSEQSKYNKYGTMIFSVGLSLYLGWFVAIGTAWYWVCSNLMAVLQLFVLNGIIRPRRYVDYEKLEKSRKELAMLQGVGKKKREGFFSANRKRERTDYKRFFSVVNKHLVFYSESNGFYKYFKGYIEYILNHTNIPIHYITSDPNDNIFEMQKTNPQIRAYYIGENKLITLMMKMDADVVVMTMPDLENYHIKKSYVRDDVEYIYTGHGTGSTNLTLRKGAVDHFDTILCVGKNHRAEIEEMEKIYDIPKKKLVDVGCPLIDELRAAYLAGGQAEHKKKQILIAPSWQEQNIIDSCLEEMLDYLKGSDYDVIVRPHPQEVRLKREYIEGVKSRFEGGNITVQTDFSANNTVMESDLLITDWSDISMEFAFATHKPVLFVNTPMKVMNPHYKDLSIVPMNILIRDKLGREIDPGELEKLPEMVNDLLLNSSDYSQQIADFAEEYIYNHGYSAEEGAKYIIGTIQEKLQKKKENGKKV